MKKKLFKDDLFKFLNKKSVKYVALRGFDENSEKLGKDLDILILRNDYEKIRKSVPKINREIDFYVGSEKHFGIIFVPGSAVKRRVFNKKLGFYVLSKLDLNRMNVLRTGLKSGRFIKRKLGMYEKK